MPLDVALFICILVIAYVAYRLGRSEGYRNGYNRGYVVGHREGQRHWIAAMERRRGSEGALLEQDRSALLRILRSAGETF